MDKRILLFTDWYSPGYKAGGPIQACRNLVDLLKDQYVFYVFCSDRDLGDTGPYRNIKTNQWLEVEPHVKIWYARPKSNWQADIRRLFAEVKPTHVYFNSMYSVSFTLLPLRLLLRQKYSGKIILAPRGMLHPGAMRRKTLKKNIFIVLFKLIGWHTKIVFHATDDQEKLDIRYHFNTGAKVFVVRDIPGILPITRQHCEKTPGELKLVFISRIHPKKNLLFCMDRLRELGGEFRIDFDIYGNLESKSYYVKCERAVRGMDSRVKIRFMGPLRREKLFETIDGYHLFVLPTLGENYGYAIFEALSAGRPVLISDQTPWRNLQVTKAGWDIALSDPARFREAIRTAAAWNQHQFDDWSKAAFEFAKSKVDSVDMHQKYSQLFA